MRVATRNYDNSLSVWMRSNANRNLHMHVASPPAAVDRHCVLHAATLPIITNFCMLTVTGQVCLLLN